MSNQISVKKQLEQIIEDKKIYPVYQPIVSLQNGDILGFEALSRIALKPCTFNVEEMFTYAEEYNCLWNLEYVCRKKALKEIKNKLGDRKLFLNIDPNIFNDERFQAGMTLHNLKRYNISPENICLIAEGIETEEEMIQLIRLGVDYGQGYFLAKPTEKLHGIPDSIRKIIITENKTTTIKQETPSFFGNVGSICQRLGTTTYDTKAVAVFEFMQKQPDITEICIVDHEQKVCGLVTRRPCILKTSI